MSTFLRKTILFGTFNVRNLPSSSIPSFLRNPDFFPLRLFSTSSNQQSFTVAYLINSLGLSPQSALSASKYVNFESSEKPDKVIHIFKKYGFTQIQISSLARIAPKLLLLDAEKIILPKLEFFEAKGISGPEMAKVLSVYPALLGTSLANKIIPSYDFFRNLFQSDEKTITAVKRFPEILRRVEKYVAPNIAILREHGVADSNIAMIMQFWPRSFVVTPDGFRKAVEEVVKMGFDASKRNFVRAVHVLLSIKKSTWESKVDTFKKLGWSEEDVLKAFQKNPQCMLVSQEKIMACMDFFTNRVGMRPCHIVECPVLLTLSLKKRLMPRYSVFEALDSKGLVKNKAILFGLFKATEKEFLQKFVTPHNKEAPELLKLYKQKLELSNAAKIDRV